MIRLFTFKEETKKEAQCVLVTGRGNPPTVRLTAPADFIISMYQSINKLNKILLCTL